MATENFTTYTENDPGDTIGVAASEITWTAIAANTDSYVYKNFGSDHFNGDFTHTFQFTPTARNQYAMCAMWAMTNGVDDLKGLDTADIDYVAVALQGYAGGITIQLRLSENGVARIHSYGSALSVGQVYYVTVTRDDDGGANGTGQITAYVCTTNYHGQAGSVAVTTLTLDCAAGEQNDYQYLFATCMYNSGSGTYTLTASVAEMDIHEGASYEELEGSVSASSSVTGTLNRDAAIRGVVAAVSSLTVTLNQTHSLTGLIEAVSQVEAALQIKSGTFVPGQVLAEPYPVPMLWQYLQTAGVFERGSPAWMQAFEQGIGEWAAALEQWCAEHLTRVMRDMGRLAEEKTTDWVDA